VIDKAEVMLLGRRNRRVFRERLLLLGLVGALLCAGCASGTATPVSGLADQEVQAAIEGLGHEDIQVRTTAAETLCGLEPEVSVPALLQALRDTEDASVRSEIVGVLGRIGPEDGVVPTLIETLLRDKDRDVREHAAVVLERVGAVEVVVPALIQAMVGDFYAYYSRATEFICGLEPEASVPVLLQALEDAEDVNERHVIINVLWRIGPEDGVAPALIKTLLHDKDRDVRGHAAVVLGKRIGPEEGVVPALIQAMVDDPSSHWAVAEGLTEIGPPAGEAVPALIDALDECASDNDLACDVERYAIVRALQAITGQDFAEDASAWREWWEKHSR
jgi:HEAT repeat protein